MEAAFARLKRIATIRTVLVAFCALGFGLFSQGSLVVAVPRRTRLRVTDVLDRGILLSLSGIAALPVLPFLGRYFDRVYRRDPAQALVLVGAADPAVGALHAAAVLGAEPRVVRDLRHPRRPCSRRRAFAMVGPVLHAVVPYRLRGMGTAMATMYIFFIGGFLGGILAGFFTDAIGTRGTVIVLGVPTSIIGGLLLMNGARFIRNDLSLVVEELLEEQEEHRKRTRARRGACRCSRWPTSTSPTAPCRCSST